MRRGQARLGDVDERAQVRELRIVPREERGCVAVGADAEEDQVEGVGQLDVQRAQRVDLLVRYGHPGEERLARQTLVGLVVLGRNDSLVAPPHVPRRPIEFEPCQPLVYSPWRRPTGQRDPKRRAAERALGDPAGRQLR